MSTKIGIIAEGPIDHALLPSLLERIARGRAGYQGLRISLGRLGALGERGSVLFGSPAGRESEASWTIDRQDHPTSSGTSAP